MREGSGVGALAGTTDHPVVPRAGLGVTGEGGHAACSVRSVWATIPASLPIAPHAARNAFPTATLGEDAQPGHSPAHHEPRGRGGKHQRGSEPGTPLPTRLGEHLYPSKDSPPLCLSGAFPAGSGVKNLPGQFRRCRRLRFDPWVGRIPWRRKWQPTLVLLPGESHGQRRPGRLQPMGSQRVRHYQSGLARTSLFFIYLAVPGPPCNTQKHQP